MDLVDQMIEKLDACWESRPFDDRALCYLLQEVQVSGPEAEELRVELCANDMEWRWRRSAAWQREGHPRRAQEGGRNPGIIGAQSLPTEHPGNPPLTADHRLPRQPAADDYRHLLGALWHQPGYRRQLKLAEWRTCNAVGDQPAWSDFLAEFPDDRSWRSDLLCQLDEISSVQVQVSSLRGLLISQRMPSEFVIGRQHTGEPNAPAWLDKSSKLIIADRHCKAISRKQLVVVREQLREFAIANGSQKVAIKFRDGVLRPGGSLRLSAPLRIALQDISIAIDVKMA